MKRQRLSVACMRVILTFPFYACNLDKQILISYCKVAGTFCQRSRVIEGFAALKSSLRIQNSEFEANR